MKVLITGATGLLGNNLTRHLLQRGDEVRVLMRPPAERRELEGLPVQSVVGSLTDPDTIDRAVRGMDVVIHAAAKIHLGWQQMEESREINVRATELMAQSARRHQVRIIHVSTVDTLPPGLPDRLVTEQSNGSSKPPCAYVATKTEAEQVIRDEVDRGLDAVIIHPGLMFGAWDWKPSSGEMLLALAKNYVPFAPRGGGSVVDVLDVCRGIAASIEKATPGRQYIMAGHNLTYLTLWRELATLIDRPRPWARLDPATSWLVGRSADLIARLKGREGPVNSASLKMGGLYHYYDSSRAIAELDYSISPLAPALERSRDFFRDYGYLR